MNKVGLFIGTEELDLFDDEQISITLQLQNIADISKLFADFTQSFTIPASPRNNKILQHYYRTDLTSSLDWKTRQEGYIEINSLPFRYGTFQLEEVQMKQNAPYAYALSFFGSVVNLTDLFGEDYLYDLDLSALDHAYNGATIIEGINGQGNMILDSGGNSGNSIIYPCITPVRNWMYNVHGGSNDELDIKYDNAGGHLHGISYYEVKPAVACTEIIAAIEAKYGITMSGFFNDNDEFQQLYMWAHRRAGWMYQNQPNAMKYRKIDFATRTGTLFDLANDTFDIPATFQNPLIKAQDGTFDFSFVVNTLSQDANFAIYVNGGYRTSQVIKTTGTFYFNGLKLQQGDRISLRVKTQDNSTSLTYGITSWEMIFYPPPTVPPTPSFSFGTARMSGTDTISVTVRVSELMPEQKIADFLIGLIKMHNLVFVPVSNSEFSVFTLDAYYQNSLDKQWDEYLDITETSIVRPEIFRRIQFKYQDAGAILGEEYRLQNGVGYGDLRADFSFDGEEFVVELPFEQLMWERLTDAETGLITDKIIVGKSIDRNLESYVGSPMLFYATGNFELSEEQNLGFIDEVPQDFPLNTIWYCNTSNRFDVNNDTTYSTNFGGDIDAYFLQGVSNGLYQTYWYDYITDLYDSSRRLVKINAQLPVGKITNIALNDKIIWRNEKWIVNSANINMTTGQVQFELLNDV
jgi:hypothetical protein